MRENIGCVLGKMLRAGAVLAKELALMHSET